MPLGIFSRPDVPEADDTGLVVIGVRHHSPACARLVEATIRRRKPAFVLIEGPADFNPHLDDLRLEHQLPVALYSYHASEGRNRASYSPFCAYSPEWQALQTAWAKGAEPLFCDLPVWHPQFGERANRYADPHGQRAAAAEAEAGRALGEDGADAIWDALAEASDLGQLSARLDAYFNLLRPDGVDDEAEAGREKFMAAYAAWAVRQARGKPVVLVCGGWHAEAIRRLARVADGTRPETPVPQGDDRAGSYLVPYDYPRLDRFTGYASGMPSPGYYEIVADEGLEAAADWAMAEITRELRAAGQVVSTADRIAWQSHASALAMTRGHKAILRSDLLDAALSSLIKDGLERPASWTEAGALAAGTHPALVAMLKAMSGTRRGKLAPGTRQPPLVADVRERMAAVDLSPTRVARKVEVDWARPEERDKAHLLHALMLLDMPGIELVDGPAAAEPRTPRETFRITEHADWQGRLIEVSRWGGTLSMAAAARLSDTVNQSQDNLGVVAASLSEALFAGLLGFDAVLSQKLAQGIGQSHDIAALGKAALSLVRLYRFGDVFGADARVGLGELLTVLFERVQWLVEAIRSDEEGQGAITAVIACRDIIRDCPELDVEADAFLAALGRCLADPETPPALAGAALGCRVACGRADPATMLGPISHFSRPDQLGDFLSGLFALSREEIAVASDVVEGVTRLVGTWADDEFLIALPAMRQAFAWFPPRERERLAVSILSAHGLGSAAAEVTALDWMRQRVRADEQVAAMALEARAEARLRAAGLL